MKYIVMNGEGGFWQESGRGGRFVSEYPDATKYTSMKRAHEVGRKIVVKSNRPAVIAANYGMDSEHHVTLTPEAVGDEEAMIAERGEADRVARALIESGATGRGHLATDFPLWLCSFLDKHKRVIDRVTYRAVSRDDARRIAVERYLENGDKAIYAGFVVSEEKHGGY